MMKGLLIFLDKVDSKTVRLPWAILFFACPKQSMQKKGHPGVSRPPKADSLAGHMISRGRYELAPFGRSDSITTVSLIMHPSRLRSDGV